MTGSTRGTGSSARPPEARGARGPRGPRGAGVAGRRREHRRDLSRSVRLSVSGHAVLVLALWGGASVRERPPEFEAIRIELYSPPPARVEAPVQEPEPAPPEPEVVVETPEPQTPDPPVEETREEVAPPPEPTPVRPEPTPPEERDPEESPPQAEPEGPGGDDIDVRLEGLRRDYPAYYANIITQIRRCFRPPPGSRHRATLQFVIHRDGTVSDIETVQTSGSLAFEIQAMGAVECAGNGRFGRLPDEFPFDQLPVQFTFDPSGG